MGLEDALGTYDLWNSEISEYFFSGDYSGKPVYLDLEHEVTAEICSRIGCETTDPESALSEVIVETLDFSGLGNPFQVHINRLKEWKNGDRLAAPPVIALLAFFSSVAEEMVADEEFAAVNYYGRLTKKLGVSGDLKDLLVDGYRKAQICWTELNSWLMDWDGELGLPTARALDFRKYVSVAISQALVRDQERRVLYRMFVECGLHPKQMVTQQEMRELLNHWVSRTGTQNSLARLWARGDEVRERTIDIACTELSEWDGSFGQHGFGSGTSAELGMKLVLTVELRRHPIPTIDIFLIAPGDSGRLEGEYELSSHFDDASKAGFENCSETLRLEDLQGDGVLSLEPWNEISAGDLLLGTFELQSKSDVEVTLKRTGAPLLALTYDQQNGIYREISQVPLLTRSIVLCREELAEKVTEHLTRCARKGFSEVTSKNLKGLPENWRAYLDVEILIQVEEPGLEALTPVMDRQLNLANGMTMGRYTWHRESPPDIEFASSGGGDFVVSISSSRLMDKTAKIKHELGQYSGACSCSISSLDLSDGDYEIKIKAAPPKKTELAKASFRLRSADHPRPEFVVKTPTLGFLASNNARLNPSSPEPLEEGGEDKNPILLNSIVGCLINIAENRTSNINYDGIAIPKEPLSISDQSNSPSWRATITETKTGLQKNCIIRGHIRWKCDEVPPGHTKYSLTRQKCMDCGLEIWTRQVDRVRKKKNKRPQFRSQEKTPEKISVQLPVMEKISSSRSFNLDSILDAISHLRGGSWQQFQDMCRFVDENKLFPYEAARVLSSLGHIEVGWDPEMMRPTSFRVSPIALVELNDGRLAMAGRRSEIIKDRLDDVVRQAGGSLDLYEGTSGVTSILISGLSDEGPEAVRSALESSISEPVSLSSSFSMRALSGARPISEVAQKAQRIGMNSNFFERFDLDVGRWVDCRKPNQPGAYRMRWRGMAYLFIDEGEHLTGKGAIVDPRTVKHLEAKRTGRNLVGYDPSNKQLLVAAGCELPALLDRAAVMCSGVMPSKSNGVLIYPDVSAEVAREIWCRLTN